MLLIGYRPATVHPDREATPIREDRAQFLDGEDQKLPRDGVGRGG